jgi:hypothetical protein
MLARAQSLSGRPHDALVMLQRLAAMGVVTDAATNEDFQRVRALSGWANLEAQVASLSVATPAESRRTEAPTSAAPKAPATPAIEPPARAPDSSAKPPDKPGAVATITGAAEDTFRFTTAPFTPAGLAYDAVSHRFIVADRAARKLTVIGERSHRVANLAGAASAGFGEIMALAIDPREGDLWVLSVADGPNAGSMLHKLQLISGRVLLTIKVPETLAPARFVDVAVGPQGTIFVLDGERSRLFRATEEHGRTRTRAPQAKSSELEVAFTLDAPAPTSVAPASETIAFVAHEDGITRVDLSSHSATAMKSEQNVELKGLAWMRWHRGSLVGVQRTANGAHQIVRLSLDKAGGRATRLTVLEPAISMAGPSSATIVGDVLYFLSDVPGSSAQGEIETLVRRVKLH